MFKRFMSPESQEVMKCVIEAAKEAAYHMSSTTVSGVEKRVCTFIDANSFIQELEKTLE